MSQSYEEEFRPRAERYRKRIRLFVTLLVCAVPVTAAAAFGPARLTVILGVLGIALVFASLITFFAAPRLVCPCCRKLADDFDCFCPVCGGAGLRRYQITAAKCNECGQTLGHYKYRNYAIHFCTHCGVLLDRRGV